MFKVASLFCGLGGSDLGILGGFTFLGHFYPRLFFDIVFAVDLDKHAVETYNKNFAHQAVCADVNDIDFTKIPQVDVLVGGFPVNLLALSTQQKTQMMSVRIYTNK